MKSKAFSQSCSIEGRLRARSLNASYYYEFAQVPKTRLSQATVLKTDGQEKSRRLLFHHRTMLIDKLVQRDKKSQKQRVSRNKMYEFKESQQRRLSCHCNECGKRSNKMNKFHNILPKSEKSIKEFWSSSNLQPQQQSLLTISTKSLKSTTTLLSIDMSPHKIRPKIESPISKRLNSNYKLISTPSINLKPYLWEQSPQKQANQHLKTDSTQLILKPISLRASAPNLETFDYSSKHSSPRRGQSNQNIKQEIQVLTQRNFSKRMIQTCYLKTFSGIHLRNTLLSTKKEIKH
ncbi:unnamed protein product (macronuclear) [Paramecium tetraurelia]|uniref:Uncharacterized protein n=1 Tax=Paramecium tetraurelia TaxID=5888 RepID=A0DKB7_PARTE|nr:uncharacterized protein GSPATT00017813001 [Paramecium tetraurelia]CAK83484.1 unnamed protein product [Paramecium tetraurelia]|eukprot:XP_001450881.1 hypothetical protein (macronuclear) [Paramecium tetraurelia strain d4-2]